jgi:hypothetical protein
VVIWTSASKSRITTAIAAIPMVVICKQLAAAAAAAAGA